MQYIIGAANAAERSAVTNLLASLKLPVEDLPSVLDNFVVATGNDAIIGVAGLELYGDYGLLRSVAVDEAWRNKNIAAALVSAIEDTARQKGLKAIILLTETADAYFAKKGYSKINRDDVPVAVKASSEFSHVCPVSAAVMQKQLQA